MPVTSARRMHPQTRKRHQGAAPQTPAWNWVAMGQMGLTGWTAARFSRTWILPDCEKVE